MLHPNMEKQKHTTVISESEQEDPKVDEHHQTCFYYLVF